MEPDVNASASVGMARRPRPSDVGARDAVPACRRRLSCRRRRSRRPRRPARLRYRRRHRRRATTAARAILQKEKELHDINEYRIQTLDGLLADKERELADAKQRVGKLKEDFTYNLKLLEERDAELERYEQSFNHLKAIIRDRDIEISELKISAAELQHTVKQERERVAESEAYYQQKMAQQREDAEALRWKLDDDLRTQRDEFEAFKREQQRAAREHTETLERERREAASAFEDAADGREREHTRKVERPEAAKARTHIRGADPLTLTPTSP